MELGTNFTFTVVTFQIDRVIGGLAVKNKAKES